MTKEDKQQLAKQDEPAPPDYTDAGFERSAVGTLSLLDGPAFERAYKMAELMASANGLPGFFQRSPGTCMAAIEEGLRLGISPFVVARMSYQAHPSAPLAYLGKFVVAMLNRSPEIAGRLEFEHVGPWHHVMGKFKLLDSTRTKNEAGQPAKYPVRNWGDDAEEGCSVIVRGTLARTGEVKELRLDMRQCYPRNSTLWATDPQQQICYVAARRWADRFTPEVLMGMGTDAEEGGEMIDVTPSGKGAKPNGPPAPMPENRLQHFVETHQPGAAEQLKAAMRTHDELTDTERASGIPHQPEQPDLPKPLSRGTTEVELCLPASSDPGDMPTIRLLGVAKAAAALIEAAQGRDVAWLDAARETNPWTRKHRYTSTALDALTDAAKARAQAIRDRPEEYDQTTGELLTGQDDDQ